jgi:outer membrane protein
MDALASIRIAASTIASSMFFLLFSTSTCAQPLDLVRALELARDNNPQYLGAQANIAVARARRQQALAQTGPQLSASATQNWNHRAYETLKPIFPTPTEISDYESRNEQLSFTQPLYRRAAFAAVSQSGAALSQSEYELLATEQEVLLKLAQAWLDVTIVQDSIEFYDAQLATAQRELDQFLKAAQLDLAASPEVEQAQANYQQALADKASGLLELQEKVAALEELLGPVERFTIPTLRDTAPAAVPPDADLDTLLELAVNEGPAVLAAQAALLAAEKEVSKQRAGHELSIDIVGTYGRNKQESGNFPGQSGYDIKQRSIGLQVNVPLYSSGLQQARVNEAIAIRRKATQELEAAARTARSSARLAWYGYQANRLRMSAAVQTIRSLELAWRTAVSGAGKGLKFEVDVLRARQDHLEAVRDGHKTYAEMLLDALRLKAVLGALTDQDVIALDGHMQPRLAATAP